MRYRLSMPEPHAHLFHVELFVDRPREEVEVVFPVWTPGSYLVREFARHVEGATAGDGAGHALPLTRVDKYRFLVRAAGAQRVVLRFRVYANELTVRTAHLDGTHGYLNPAAVLPYVRGRQEEPHVVEVASPAGWHVSTALAGGPIQFTARDYDELADSPMEIGTHRTLRFLAMGKAHEIALWGRGNLDEDAFVNDARRIVDALGGMMGGLPFERYLFIVHLADRRRGGLEHAASTTLQLARAGFFPRKEYEESLGLLAHELFHAWNVKRLRPAAFVPYDYAREQYTRLLWWFEGATSYYEQVALVRAGIMPAKRWLEALGQALTSLERTPGAAKMSLEEASLLAWVKHYRPDENTPNSAVSYYLKGELVSFALDLALRRQGRSLDELLRELHGRYEKTGVPEDGVERVAAELLGADAARGFFDRFVRGTEPLALELDAIGLRLRRRAAQGLDDKGGTPGKEEEGSARAGWLGAEIPAGPKLLVASVREGSPAHRAGLYAGDEIVAEDGFRIERAVMWDRLQERGPGGKLRLTVFRRDELLPVEVVLGEPPEDAIWLERVAQPTPAQRAAYESWSAGSWPASA
jgi:predicted metalloprotease with PDZ domain